MAHDDIRKLGVRERLANVPVVITGYARDEPGPTAGVQNDVGRPGMLGQPASGGPVSPPRGMAGPKLISHEHGDHHAHADDSRRPGDTTAPGQFHPQPAQANEGPRRRPGYRDRAQGAARVGPRGIRGTCHGAPGPGGKRMRKPPARVVRFGRRHVIARGRMPAAEAEDESLPRQAPDRHDGETPAELVPPLDGDPSQGFPRIANRRPLRLFLGREVPSGVVEPLGSHWGTGRAMIGCDPSAAACRSASFSETWPLTSA